jgi:hypothetical protein
MSIFDRVRAYKPLTPERRRELRLELITLAAIPLLPLIIWAFIQLGVGTLVQMLATALATVFVCVFEFIGWLLKPLVEALVLPLTALLQPAFKSMEFSPVFGVCVGSAH